MLFRKTVAIIVTGCFLSMSLSTGATAGVIGAQQYLQAADRQVLLDRIDSTLQRDDVQKNLVASGVDPAQAMARVHALNDQELQQMTNQFDEMPAGGILGLIGAVFVVLLILELTGVIDIFKRA